MFAQFRFAFILIGLVLVLGASKSGPDINRDVILSLVNQDRIEHGLKPLEANPVLDLAAWAKAQDMFEQGYFSHTSPGGVSPWHWFESMGYAYSYAGENLARGFTDPVELEESWMESPTHRANILSPFYSEIGLAVLRHGQESLVVQFFGSTENKVTLRQ